MSLARLPSLSSSSQPRQVQQTTSSQGEKINYVDVTSLYSRVNKTEKYSVGHPVIIRNPQEHRQLLWYGQYFGTAKVDILLPPLIYHPVLPRRHRGKLTFPFCRSCMEEKMQKVLLDRFCRFSHNLEQRVLRGTWCTPEHLKAVEHGYHILHILHIHGMAKAGNYNAYSKTK